MAQLHIALQDGFTNDTVVIRVNGAEAYRRENLRTRLQIGLADSVELEAPDGPARVEIALPQRGIADSLQLDLRAPMYLGVSVTGDGQFSYRRSEVPFGYV